MSAPSATGEGLPTAVGLFAVALVFASGCGYEHASGDAMGTTYALQGNCPGDLPAPRIGAELDRLNGLMSTYDRDSELSRFNQGPTGVVTPVAPDLARVVAVAGRVADMTGGAFDPTVAPLVALWGFGAEPAPGPPTRQDVADARRLVDHRRIGIRLAPPTLEKLAPATVDLSGIAKGYAVDRIADILDARGCRAYLIELGGEIRASGRAPGGGAWRVGVESPAGLKLATTVKLEGGGMATSGDYRQYREEAGNRVSHVIDPRSGYPVAHRLASVTVIAENAMLADAYATALLVMGDGEGMRFADTADLAALFIVRDDHGFRLSSSRAMAGYLADH